MLRSLRPLEDMLALDDVDDVLGVRVLLATLDSLIDCLRAALPCSLPGEEPLLGVELTIDTGGKVVDAGRWCAIWRGVVYPGGDLAADGGRVSLAPDFSCAGADFLAGELAGAGEGEDVVRVGMQRAVVRGGGGKREGEGGWSAC